MSGFAVVARGRRWLVPLVAVATIVGAAPTDHGAAVVVDGVTPGRVFNLTADAGTWQDDFDVAFYGSLAACRAGQAKLAFTNHAGDEDSVVPAGAGTAVVTLAGGTPPAAFTYTELADAPSIPVRLDTARKPTVVA